MPTVTLLLVVAAFFTTIVSIMGKCPLWLPVLILCLVALLQVLPR